MTEWNLSDKIGIGIYERSFELSKHGDRLKIEDVKEFIRRLKEEIKKQEIDDREEVGGGHCDCITCRMNLIDKLAGEKLQ